MTSYKFGVVVLVPFPFTDQKSSKKHPAVVISSDVYHHQRPDLILIAVTSQVRPSTLIGEMTITDWREAGLLKPSI
jgi:mRNA interferase MazF